MNDERAIRWIDRIPVLWMIGVAIVTAIVWIVNLSTDVKQNKADIDRWKASIDARSETRNKESEEMRTRMTRVEDWKECLQRGGCDQIGRNR